MIVGFTGTQAGLTPLQRERLKSFLSLLGEFTLHHGDCVGADAEAHQLVLALSGKVEIHPPLDNSKRAFCKGATITRAPKSYLERNHQIVDACEILIACPRTAREQRRSGTWATVRYARKIGRPVELFVP